jgi:ATP-dependent DNA ligase
MRGRTQAPLPLVEAIIPVLRDQPFDDPAYLFEPEYDGFRGLLYVSPRECYFRPKRGNLHYAAFDALWLKGKDLRRQPLTRRKRGG